ncbi:MAG TPA: DNA alkylation repair protein [Ignavibacteria bacterium]|nr:DNA alkylation repair protein [Ignavibacteria bacterium]
MKDSLLSEKEKKEILKMISVKKYPEIIFILDKHSTAHAGTAKTKDKRFVITEITKFINKNSKNPVKDFYTTGKKFLSVKSDNAKEIGIALLRRGYKQNPADVKKWLCKIADDKNWEVRESAGGAFAGVLNANPELYDYMCKLCKHKSENVRRAVLFSAHGLIDEEKNLTKALKLIEKLLTDSSVYVKKNLGPFILGSYFANRYPQKVQKQILKWTKKKDEHLRWNLAMTYKNSFGNKYPEYALQTLLLLNSDLRPVVQRAVKSTINFLSKRHPEKVKKLK